MSVRYVAVQWTKAKLVYDACIAVGIVLFLQTFTLAAGALLHGERRLSGPVLDMRAYGACAFLLVTIVLCIGPLARLDRRLSFLLYNRRHLGVATAAVGFLHARAVLGFYYAYSATPPLDGLLTVDASFTASSLPFPLFGAAALAIFLMLAATSHDFWQRFLGPALWKWLHLSIYAAYALAVLHVAYGALLGDATPFFVAPFVLSVGLVVGLHLAAARHARSAPSPRPREGWIDAGPVRAIPRGRVLPVLRSNGERIALVRTTRGLSAVHGVCAHQGGPLWRGEVLDDCLTCPWHGWQYRPEDGCAPPPFTEKIPTHQVRIVEGRVEVKDAPEPAGTALPPCPVEEPEVGRG